MQQVCAAGRIQKVSEDRVSREYQWLGEPMVRLKGLEPSRRFQRYHLKVVRLPIPPQPQARHLDPADHGQQEPSAALQSAKTPQVTERCRERKRHIGIYLAAEPQAIV